MDINDIERITLDVMAAHGCHTAILYGSWARGEATSQSDVDILYVRENGPFFRDARLVDGIYLDAFIYPEAALASPEPELLRVLGGRVILEANGFGNELLAKLRDLHDRGPAPMPDDMRRVTLLWSQKMLDRFWGRSGLEPQYRRKQLLLQSLEDYFALRRAWFRGPKEAFAWLLQHDTATYQRFERAAQPDANDTDFAELVRAVYESRDPGAGQPVAAADGRP
jgi:predicted nucleotidyltransferase